MNNLMNMRNKMCFVDRIYKSKIYIPERLQSTLGVENHTKKIEDDLKVVMLHTTPKRVFMVKPANFGFDSEAAETNVFQSNQLKLSAKEVIETAKSEFKAMVNNLKENGVNVTVFEDSNDPIKPDAVFPNNWISFMPDGTRILYPMCVSSRRNEIRSEIYEHERLKHTNSTMTKIINLRHYVSQEKFLEGTGSVVFDHKEKIAFACRSPRTHKGVLDDLCAQIGYRSVFFDAEDQNGIPVYHTNVIMCIGETWSVVCLDFITDKADRERVRNALCSDGQSRVFELSPDAIKNFAGNCFEVQTEGGAKNALIVSESGWNAFPEDFKSFINENLVLCKSPIPVIEKVGGGSARCMVAGIYFD